MRRDGCVAGTLHTGCDCRRSAYSSTAPASTSWRSAASSWMSTCARCWATPTSAVRRPAWGFHVHTLHLVPERCRATMSQSSCLVRDAPPSPVLVVCVGVAEGIATSSGSDTCFGLDHGPARVRAGTKDVWEFLSAWSEVYGTEENTSLLKAMGHSLDAARTNVRRFAGDVGKVCGARRTG